MNMSATNKQLCNDGVQSRWFKTTSTAYIKCHSLLKQLLPLGRYPTHGTHTTSCSDSAFGLPILQFKILQIYRTFIIK